MTAADASVEAVATTATLLIALDFDGTLSPLVDEPMSARMTPDARAVLESSRGGLRRRPWPSSPAARSPISASSRSTTTPLRGG